MSAAEKLRALDQTMQPWEQPPADVLDKIIAPEAAAYRILDALPQIVAVVEAAEIASQTETVSMLDEDAREQLTTALTALSEQLGDVT